ncbi:MAG: hypothetical protein BWX80_03379 [Candidatus Hydrogenedentes bacterium ADurb.Bin101]|nr:MAG: hypothetical protein BWX80_03379 [Candidatus Hydrogenedentes bacterium ADurb.Bin101]
MVFPALTVGKTVQIGGHLFGDTNVFRAAPRHRIAQADIDILDREASQVFFGEFRVQGTGRRRRPRLRAQGARPHAADFGIDIQHFAVPVPVDNIQTVVMMIVRVVAHEKMVPGDGIGVPKSIRITAVHLVAGPRIRCDIGNGLRIKGALAPVYQGDGAFVRPVRHQRADKFVGARNLMSLAVAIGRIVSKNQLGVRAIGADGPEGMAEVRALVDIFGPRPENEAVARDRRFPFAQVGEGKPPYIGAVPLHAVKDVGLGPPAEKAQCAPGRDERHAAIGQHGQVKIMKRALGKLPHVPAVHR